MQNAWNHIRLRIISWLADKDTVIMNTTIWKAAVLETGPYVLMDNVTVVSPREEENEEQHVIH